MIQPDIHDPLSGPFWKAAREQQLVMSWCDDCNQAVWYPEPECPVCRSGLYWKPLSGQASLLSWTVVRKPVNPVFMPLYIPALVIPVEAPHARLVTQLVDCSPESLRCDMTLKVQFRELTPQAGNPYVAPVFTPVS